MKYVVSPDAATTTVSVDPAGGNVFAARGEEVVAYDASGASERDDRCQESNPVAPSKASRSAVLPTSSMSPRDEGTGNVEVFGPCRDGFPPCRLRSANSENVTDSARRPSTGTVDPNGFA